MNQLRLHQETEKEEIRANEIPTSQPSPPKPNSETEKPNVILEPDVGSNQENAKILKENVLGNTITSQLSDIHLSDYNIDKITQLRKYSFHCTIRIYFILA